MWQTDYRDVSVAVHGGSPLNTVADQSLNIHNEDGGNEAGPVLLPVLIAIENLQGGQQIKSSFQGKLLVRTLVRYLRGWCYLTKGSWADPSHLQLLWYKRLCKTPSVCSLWLIVVLCQFERNVQRHTKALKSAQNSDDLCRWLPHLNASHFQEFLHPPPPTKEGNFFKCMRLLLYAYRCKNVCTLCRSGPLWQSVPGPPNARWQLGSGRPCWEWWTQCDGHPHMAAAESRSFLFCMCTGSPGVKWLLLMKMLRMASLRFCMICLFHCSLSRCNYHERCIIWFTCATILYYTSIISDSISKDNHLVSQSPNSCSVVEKKESSPKKKRWSGIWQCTIKKAVKLRPQNSDEVCGRRGEWTQTCSGAADIWRLAVGDSAQHELFSSESRRPIFLVNSSRCYFSIDAHLQKTFLFVLVVCRAS